MQGCAKNKEFEFEGKKDYPFLLLWLKDQLSKATQGETQNG